MSDHSSIEWTEATWNPLTGCTKVSPGCDHCYAETFAERFRGTPGHHFERGFDLTLRPERLAQPLRWRKPRRIFVNSMSDLFHADVPDEYIDRVFGVMAANLSHEGATHTFQLLTKRHARMRSYLSSPDVRRRIALAAAQMTDGDHADATHDFVLYGDCWPLPNVHPGVSVEDQKWAEIRIPALWETPAAVRWVSLEPLLGPVSFRWAKWAPMNGAHDLDGLRGLDWVVLGGESGRGARPMHPEWARTIRDQCAAAGVPFLFKQWGAWAPVPRDDYRETDTAVALDGGEPAPGSVVPWEVIRTNAVMRRVGKKAAGRELDGALHDGYPAAVLDGAA